MKALFRLISSIAVFFVAFSAAVSFLSEKAKESRYIVIDDQGNELF